MAALIALISSQNQPPEGGRHDSKVERRLVVGGRLLGVARFGLQTGRQEDA
jgi:hypothetical protein